MGPVLERDGVSYACGDDDDDVDEGDDNYELVIKSRVDKNREFRSRIHAAVVAWR